MRSFVEVLCPGNADSGSAIHIFLDGVRYQFGCGDGVQRTATEASVKPAKLSAIFLPSLAPADVGGLPGMLLTAADAGLEKICIAGPVGLKAYLHAARSFFLRPALEIDVVEIDGEAIASRSKQIAIRGVQIPSASSEPERKFPNGRAGEDAPSIAYVARLADIRGRFDPAKAASLGVPRGRMYGVLQRGSAVTLEDGTEVRPEQVMDLSTPGPVVVVIPSLPPDAIASFAANDAFSQASLETDGRLSLIVHLSSQKTLLDTRYLAWTRALGGGVRHLALHVDFAPERVIYASNAEEMARLHFTVDEGIFPLPVHATRPHAPTVNPALDPVPAVAVHPPACGGLPDDWLLADFKLRLLLAPRSDAGRLDRSLIPDALIPRDASAPLRPWRVSAPRPASSPPPVSAVAGMTLRFLGTGSALPGKHRNVSGMHLSVSSRLGVLLDAGEGSLGQLSRALGRDGCLAALHSLRVAFISHMHADHHLGLPAILTARAAAGATGQVAVIGPRALEPWLLTSLGDSAAAGVSFFDARDLTDPQAPAAGFFADSLGLEMGTVPILHCPDAFAAVLRGTSGGWKVVYSGDTRPCDALIEAGSDATLLIHEATLDDRLGEEAKAKMHSTTGEALGVAERMGAWRTLLTHFSQRYPKVTALDERTVERMETVGACLACDFMTVGFERLEELPRLTRVLREVYEQEVEELLVSAPMAVAEEVVVQPT